MTPVDGVHDNTNISRPQQRVTKKSELVNNDSNQSNSSDNLNECHTSQINGQVFKPEIIWFELIAQIFLHTGFLFGACYLVTLQAKFFTYIWCKYNLRMNCVTINETTYTFIIIPQTHKHYLI